MVNLEWLKKNFGSSPIIFDIGSSGINTTPKIFRTALPDAVIYAFECSDYWKEENYEVSLRHNIKYFHVAMSDTDGKKMFIPSLTQHGEDHPFSGSFYKDNLPPSYGKVYGTPYEVETIRYDTFCRQHNITPDFIHIDVEGEEYTILSCLGEFRPKCIWAEVVGFGAYHVPHSEEEFNIMLINQGYELVGKTEYDGLYCLKGYNITPYDFTSKHEFF